MMEKLSFRKNFLWIFGGTGFFNACQWFSMVAMARICQPEQVGQFSLAVALCSPIILMSGMNLRMAIVSDFSADYKFIHYLRLRIFSGVISVLLIAILCLWCKYDTYLVLMILTITIEKLFLDVATVYYGKFQLNERMDLISKSYTVRGGAGVILFVLLLLMSKNILLAVAGRAIISITALFFFEIPKSRIFKNETPLIFKRNTYSLFKKVFPLGVVMGIMSLKTNIPRYFIAEYCGEDMLGYFTAINVLLIAIHMPVHALSETALARLSKYFNSDMNQYIKLFRKLILMTLLIGIFLVVGTSLFGEVFITLIYKSDYARYWQVLFIGSIGTVFGFIVSMASAAFIVTRKFKMQMFIYLIVLLVTLICSYILIPRYGIIGASWVNVISSLIHSIMFGFAISIASYKGRADLRFQNK